MVFLFFELHFDFFHFLADAVVGGHCLGLAEELDAEDEEEACGEEVCEGLGD